MNPDRRKLLLGMGGLMSLYMSPGLAALSPTPAQTAGPFYPVKLPLDDDNDLTMVSGQSGRSLGSISDVSGRIVDINGNPVSNMRIEIWQCDNNGRYRHPRESGIQPIDPNFQGHGHTYTNQNGQYLFRTIRPVQYPGRTPHIHVAAFPDGEPPFVTQLYVAGEKRNETDFIYNNIPWDKRDLVTAEFKPAHTPAVQYEAKFDIILNRRDGTPQNK